MHTLQDASEKLYANLIQKIHQVKLQHPTALQQAEDVIPLCLEYLQSLRSLLKSFRYIKPMDEIHFFKTAKPRFVSQYILHVNIFRLHSRWPMGNEQVQRNYLEGELYQINHFFEQNHHFCCYYRANSTYLDHTYFVRGQHDIEPSLDQLFFETDPRFHTPRDLMAAQLLANSSFQVYVEEQLFGLGQSRSASTSAAPATPLLTWTDSKIALIELGYSLHASGSLNNGKADIKTIFAELGKTFSIEVGEYYDSFMDIRMRKISLTKFLDFLKSRLLKRIEEMNDHLFRSDDPKKSRLK